MRKTFIKKSRVFNNTYFPGLVHCGECESIMSSVFTNKIKRGKRTRYYYYRCTSIDKRDRDFCGIRQVSADRLDNLIINYLDSTMKNDQYLDSLIFMRNNSGGSAPKGLELKGVRSPLTAEKLKEIFKDIINASKLPGKFEKRDIMRSHIEKIIYSKETIEVKILYSESVAPCIPAYRAAYGPLCDPSAGKRVSSAKDKAAFRHCAPQSRPTKMVRSKIEARPPFSASTFSLIIPNAFTGLRARTLDPQYNKWRPLLLLFIVLEVLPY